MDLLPQCGDMAFAAFVEALRDEYDWLAEELEKPAPPNPLIEDVVDIGTLQLEKPEEKVFDKYKSIEVLLLS